MRKITALFLVFCLIVPNSVSAAPGDSSDGSIHEDFVSDIASPAEQIFENDSFHISNNNGLRVMFISDIHWGKAPNPHVDYDDGTASGAESGVNADLYDEDRVNLLVEAANLEHQKNPVDLCVIVGDVVQLSGTLSWGSLLSTETEAHKIERMNMLRTFKQKVPDRLDMPCYVMPGNHDVYTDDEWRDVFGLDKSFVIENANYAFVCVDMYSTAVSFPLQNNSFGSGFKYTGVENGVAPDGQTPLYDWVTSKVAEGAEAGKKSFLVWHTFDKTVDTEVTKIYQTFMSDSNIVGQIAGHSHRQMPDSDMGKKYVGTGNFGYMHRYQVTASNPYTGSSYTHLFSNGTEYADVTTCYYSFKIMEQEDDHFLVSTVLPEITYRTFCGGYHQPYQNRLDTIIWTGQGREKLRNELTIQTIQNVINIELRLKNEANVADQTYLLIAAFYGEDESNMLKSEVLGDTGIPQGSTSKCFSATAPHGTKFAKVFLWDSFGRLTPLRETKIESFRNIDSEHLRMAVLSDIHVGADESAWCGLDPMERMQLLVDSVNAEHAKKPIDVVLITGDVVADGGLYDFFKDWLTYFASQLEMPIYYVRGNHDRYTDANWTYFAQNSLKYSFETAKYSFVVLDSYPNIYEYNSTKQYKEVDDEDIAFIEQELEKRQGKPAFVVSHYLSNITESGKIGMFANMRNDVIGLLYGHSHVFNNNVKKGYFGLSTGSFFEPTYEYPTLDEILKGSKSRYLLGWRMLEETEDGSLVTYQVQPANYYPYWNLDYPYTIQQNLLIKPGPVITKEGITVRASDYEDETHTPEHSIDNKLSTYWSAEGDGQWIEYFFDEPRELNQVLISFYNASETRKAKFEILVSQNGTDYTQVFNGKSTGSTDELEAFSIPNQINIKSVKIIGHGNTVNKWIAINEVDFK